MLPTRFQELLDGFARQRVLVLGDFILDEYLIGNTKRVSREAPVIVIDYRESRFHPGGAANAAQNVAVLGGKARALGVLGEDREGSILSRLLEEKGVRVDGLEPDAALSTAVKTRILAGELHAQRQQVARIDRSHEVAASSPALAKLETRLRGELEDTDAVLISDYGMGVAPSAMSRAALDYCREARLPVIVDSRFNLLEFEGATVATPNETELYDAMRLQGLSGNDLAALAPKVLAERRMDGMIVTRGSRGMVVYSSSADPVPVGIVGSREVTDVTGAGDTVSATVALSLACGATLPEAAEMATYAAAIVVMKRGTATVSAREMLAIRFEHAEPSDPTLAESE